MLSAGGLNAVDSAVRGGLCLVLLLSAALLLRDRRQSRGVLSTVWLAVGVTAYVLHSAPEFPAPPGWVWAPVVALATGTAVQLWLWAAQRFDDSFRWRFWHGLVWALFASLGLLNCYVCLPLHLAGLGGLRLGLTVAPVGFAALALSAALRSWNADLVEDRRRLRVFMVVSAAAYTLLSVGAKLLAAGYAPELLGLVDMLLLSGVVLSIAWRVLGATASGLFSLAADPVPVVPPMEQISVAPEVQVQPVVVDEGLTTALLHQIEVARAYRDAELTIGALAERLGVAEYKLRRLINQGLGYRNFNVFLNHYRIEAAKAALRDPSQAAVSILSIAMDCGFQSLGPFNRAFKAMTGCTPSEYRRGLAPGV